MFLPVPLPLRIFPSLTFIPFNPHLLGAPRTLPPIEALLPVD